MTNPFSFLVPSGPDSGLPRVEQIIPLTWGETVGRARHFELKKWGGNMSKKHMVLCPKILGKQSSFVFWVVCFVIAAKTMSTTWIGLEPTTMRTVKVTFY